MEKRTDLKIPYGIADFKRIRNEGWYYVDKTKYLAKLEERDSFVFFVRPRRFGKSLFLDMLRLYYDRNERANFEKLFGGLWLGEHPTENRNRYLMLALDFSKAEDGIRKLRQYAADPSVPTLAKDTRLHLILYQFKGTELIRLEEIPA